MPINPKLVHVFQLVDAVEARPEGAWVFQYRGESFMTDPRGGNPQPFAWIDQPHLAVDFGVMTREEIAGRLRINPAKLGFVKVTDPSFPPPIVEFRDGPIWAADAIDAWAPTRRPDLARDRGVPSR